MLLWATIRSAFMAFQQTFPPVRKFLLVLQQQATRQFQRNQLGSQNVPVPAGVQSKAGAGQVRGLMAIVVLAPIPGPVLDDILGLV